MRPAQLPYVAGVVDERERAPGGEGVHRVDRDPCVVPVWEGGEGDGRYEGGRGVQGGRLRGGGRRGVRVLEVRV